MVWLYGWHYMRLAEELTKLELELFSSTTRVQQLNSFTSAIDWGRMVR